MDFYFDGFCVTHSRTANASIYSLAFRCHREHSSTHSEFKTPAQSHPAHKSIRTDNIPYRAVLYKMGIFMCCSLARLCSFAIIFQIHISQFIYFQIFFQSIFSNPSSLFHSEFGFSRMNTKAHTSRKILRSSSGS